MFWARVSSLFGRRGYNIDSLTVSATNDPRVSRMSIIVQGDEVILEQIIKQLDKLEEVSCCRPHREHDSVCSELVFVKLHAQAPSTRDDIRQLCSLYEGRIVDSTEDELIVELANVPEPHRRLPRRHFQLRDRGDEPLGRHRDPQIISFRLIDGHLTAD